MDSGVWIGEELKSAVVLTQIAAEYAVLVVPCAVGAAWATVNGSVTDVLTASVSLQEVVIATDLTGFLELEVVFTTLDLSGISLYGLVRFSQL